jgi:hypothetical protein
MTTSFYKVSSEARDIMKRCNLERVQDVVSAQMELIWLHIGNGLMDEATKLRSLATITFLDKVLRGEAEYGGTRTRVTEGTPIIVTSWM